MILIQNIGSINFAKYLQTTLIFLHVSKSFNIKDHRSLGRESHGAILGLEKSNFLKSKGGVFIKEKPLLMTEIIFIGGCCLLAFNMVDGCVKHANKEQEIRRDVQLKMTYLPPKEQFKKSVFYEISGICKNFKDEESKDI